MPATSAQDRQFLALLKDVLEQGYRDGIDRFLQLAIAEDGTTTGTFSDRGKIFNFKVATDGIRYQPLSREKLDSRTAGFVSQLLDSPFAKLGSDAYSVSLLETMLRADAKGKKSQCRVGYACGSTCINNQYECRISRLNLDKRKVEALVDGAKVIHKIGGGPLLTALLGAAAIAVTSFAVGAAVGAYGAGISRPPNPNRAAPPPPNTDPKPEAEKAKRKRRKPEPETAEEAKAEAEAEQIPIDLEQAVETTGEQSERSPEPTEGQMPIDFNKEYVVEREMVNVVPKAVDGVVYLKPDQIRLAPDLFQYKIQNEASAKASQQYREQGTTGALSDVEVWNPELAGTLQMWRVPQTFTHKGVTYYEGESLLTHGHHRLALAKRLGVGEVKAEYLNVPTWQEAKAIGAMQNIAQGAGTAKDAANLFRTMKLSEDELKRRGISMRQAIAEQGLGLAGLNARLWDIAANPNNPRYGELSVNRGAMIGRVKNPDLQDEIWKNIQDRSGVTDAYVESLSTTAQHRLEKGRVQVDPGTDNGQGALFDMGALVANLADRSEMDGYFENQIRSEASFWRRAAKPKRMSEILTKEGAGVVDIERAEQVSEQTAIARYLYRKSKLTVSDPNYETVNRMLDENGDQLKAMRQAGKTKAEIDEFKKQSWQQLRNLLEGAMS